MTDSTSLSTFLGEAADILLREAGSDLGRHIVLLPGKRGSLFLKRELAARMDRPGWAPRFMTLNEFVSERLGLRPAEQSELVFKAYEAYLGCGGTESFEEALRWIHSAVGDFAAVDHALADASKLFTNLRHIREIENWSLRDEPLSEHQSDMVVFWDQLGRLYHAFREALRSENSGYPAMIMRHAAEHPELLSGADCRNALWMVGFNVLSRAEQQVARHLVREAGLRFLWDADEYYLRDELQEAGLHLREEISHFPSQVPPCDRLGSSPKTIRLYPLSGEVAQAKEAARLLETARPEGTAVVLANEGALPAVLNSIPPRIESFNVSAGIRMSHTPLNDLVSAFFALCPKRHTGPEEIHEIYHRHLLRFLESPLIANLCEKEEPGLVGRFRSALIRDYRIMVNWAEDTAAPEFRALQVLNPLMDALSSGKASDALRALAELSDILHSIPGLSEPEEEYAFQLGRMARQVLRLTERYPFADSIPVLRTLMMSLLRTETITFYGEPLTGLQILGLLETRGLDFRHVILMGANEGILPGPKTENSLIPNDLKQAFGLPDYKHREALHAYYFYRLIQRAETIDILYTESGSEGGEMSRFVRQLLLEAPEKNPAIQIQTIPAGQSLNPAPKEVEIAMNQDIAERIKHQLEGGLSPTALSKFIACPLDFYYRYVLGLGEPEEMEETPEAATFGSIIHDALEELYTPFAGGPPLTEADLHRMLEQADDIVKKRFTRVFPEKHLRKGQNFLTYRASKLYARNLISVDIRRVNSGEEVRIHSLEKDFKSDFEAMPDVTVRFRGKVDRIETDGTHLRIVDYKTGKGEEKDLTIKTAEDFDKKTKALQLMIYAWLWQRQHPESPPLKAGIIFLRNHSKGLIGMTFNDSDLIGPEELAAFETYMTAKITDLLNKNLKFTHNPKSRFCLYCGE